MSDDEDLPTSRLKGDESNLDPESAYLKVFKNKMGSRRSYYIVLTILMFIFAVLILAVFGLSYVYLTKAVHCSKTCTTEDCLRSATLFVESMNKSVNPCDDFYQFACGNFGNVHRIPKTSFSNERFSEVHELMLTLIRDFMEKEDSDSEPYSVYNARVLYRSCMATDKMDEVGLGPLVRILKKVGLPPLGIERYSKNKNATLSSILATTKKHLNLDYVFLTTVDASPKNRTNNRIILGKPSESNLFPVHKTIEVIKKMSSRKIRETLTSEEKVDNENDSKDNVTVVNEEREEFIKSYSKYFKSVWMEIAEMQSNHSIPSKREFVNELSTIMLFDNDFSKIRDRIYDTDDQLPIVMTVNEWQMYTDNITQNASKSKEQIINWKEYLTILFVDVENTTLDFETDLLEINNIQYFEALFEMLVKYRQTQVINIWWRVVTTLLPYTTNKMRFVQDRFYYETSGLESNPSRSIYCASAVNKMMGKAVSYLLLDIPTIKHNTNMVVEMMENIQWAFEKIVIELKWMDDITKRRTLQKTKKMKTLIGFPEFINDSNELDEYYSNIEVNENDYFGNVIRFVQNELNYTLMALRTINDYGLDSWASDPLEVNAFNWIQANSITVPAGILQFPFFGHDLQVLNYGFLGSIVGHELTHSFDNTGRRFDQDGNENMWWTNQTIEAYENRTNCFIEHYESYSLPGDVGKVNGKLTLDENIADNGGIREALLAYRKFVVDHGEESKLPGLEEFSNEQLYYLAFANTWCEASTTQSLSNSLLNEHSPNYIRVVAGLTNSEEFSEVWKCEKGTIMNPMSEKCKIW